MIASDLADSMDTEKLTDDQSEAVSMVTALRLAALPCLLCPAVLGAMHSACIALAYWKKPRPA